MFSKTLCDFLETLDDTTLLELDYELKNIEDNESRLQILKKILLPKYPDIKPLLKNAFDEDYIQPLELFPYQMSHLERLSTILQQSPIALDTSPLGSGKTFTSLALALRYSFPIFVVGPKTLEPVWTELASLYGIPLVNYLSYQKLRSVKGKEPKHPYLQRREKDGQTIFTPTKEWTNLIKNGILLIVDEVQLIKNRTDQYEAVKALIEPILENPDVSRVLLLSGTPFDKESNAVNLVRLLGYIRQDKLGRKGKDKYEFYGLQDLIDNARRINPDKTERLLRTYPLNPDKIDNFVYRIYIDIIQPFIRSQMPLPPIQAEKDVKNYYALVLPSEQTRLRNAVLDLATVTQYNRRTGDVSKEANFGAVTKALMEIETAKIPILERQIRKSLEKRGKVIVFVQYTSSIEELANNLKEYNPVLLYGKTSIEDRAKAIDKFQNDPKTRLLIGNLRVGGLGLSLHDTRGNEPRTLYVIPNYSLLDLTQAVGRIYRQGTKSKATVRFLYGDLDLGVREVQILTALARKSKVLKEILDIQGGEVMFPGDYQDEFEK